MVRSAAILATWLFIAACTFPDANMKVSLSILKRVYDNLQSAGETGSRKEGTYLEPNKHLFFIDAFEMPCWHWSHERGAFEKSVASF